MNDDSLSLNQKIKFKRKNLPEKPGCYIFKDKSGKIIYVGKAKSLKKRVNSYWNHKNTGDPLYSKKITNLLSKINDIDFFIVENESEALILENELIKKHQPKFNAMLKDDKSFPWIQITNEKYPRIRIIRQPEKHGIEHEYLGPFISIGKLKKMLKFIRKIFPFCTCPTNYNRIHRKRPCTYYQIKLCPAPCFNKISEKNYKENIEKVKQLLMGNVKEIEDYIIEKMEFSSKNLDFEEAVIWRDRLEALEMFTVKQSILLFDLIEDNSKVATNVNKVNEKNKPIGWKTIDVVSGYISDYRVGLIILHVRKGRLIGKTPYIIDIRKKIGVKNKIFYDLFHQHYFRDDIIKPDEIIINQEISSTLIDALKQKYEENPLSDKKSVIIKKPSEIEKTNGLMRIADKNIQLLVKQRDEFEEYSEKTGYDEDKIHSGLHEFKKILHLNSPPIIMEAFDMSHFQGSDYVGSKVSFFEGKPNKREYRRYKVKGNIHQSDDVGAMKEILERRYSRLVKENEIRPDLIIVDGGIGQVKMLNQILHKYNLQDIVHIGIAKPEGRSEINNTPTIVLIQGEKIKRINLPLNSPSLHILQHIRDESHRFAIQYHKKLRNKRNTRSELDKIPGIGPVRKKKLLTFFGSIENIKKAKLDAISEIIGEKIGNVVFNYFHDKKLLESKNINKENKTDNFNAKDGKERKKIKITKHNKNQSKSE